MYAVGGGHREIITRAVTRLEDGRAVVPLPSRRNNGPRLFVWKTVVPVGNIPHCHPVARCSTTLLVSFLSATARGGAGLGLRDIRRRDVVDPHASDVAKEQVRHLDVDVLGDCRRLVLIHPHVVDWRLTVDLS